MRRVWVLVLLVLLVGCTGGGGKGGTTTATPTVLINAFLFQHNAIFRGGFTVRWEFLPITVDTGGVPGAEGKFNRWRDATGGAVTFSFVTSGAGVVMRVEELDQLDPDLCGLTIVEFPTGNIIRADIILDPDWNTPDCIETIAHEAGHAIGFLVHTSDGGLMDLDGGNGEITGQVADMIRTLYSYPPGTMVKAAQVARGTVTARGGPQRMTFVTPKRRR